MSQARRDVSDEAAAAALRLEIRNIPTDVLDREVSEWSAWRQDYLADRAYRLLVAAHGGGPVAPIEPSDRIRFEQEEILGRLPLRDAFGRLAEAEPKLRRLEEAALAGKKVRLRDLDRDLGVLVGPSARRSAPVLQGKTAREIAFMYVWARAQGRDGNFKSFFEQPRHESRTIVHGRPMDQ
jgi:hypothetical protein